MSTYKDILIWINKQENYFQVGMAEAKKREAEVKKKVEARAAADKASRPTTSLVKADTAASALQMLQSAYDENDKK